MQNCSFWIPIDPVPEETSIQFVKGSHRWGKWFTPKKFATSLNYQREKQSTGGRVYEEVPDVDSYREMYDLLQWQVEVSLYVVKFMTN